ncbi:MAG: hypothetical protein PVJ68_10400 [Candidatus Thiodiazotropha sp.]|jgi:hypothetical protein
MFKTDDNDFSLDAVMELRETYPDAVLESEWNPVIAQMQLLKRRRQEQEQSSSSLWLTLPDMDVPDHKA